MAQLSFVSELLREGTLSVPFLLSIIRHPATIYQKNSKKSISIRQDLV